QGNGHPHGAWRQTGAFDWNGGQKCSSICSAWNSARAAGCVGSVAISEVNAVRFDTGGSCHNRRFRLIAGNRGATSGLRACAAGGKRGSYGGVAVGMIREATQE